MINFNISKSQIDNIIFMAWSDNISFEEIKRRHGISEKDVIKIMRYNLKERSYKLWRKRVNGRISKHEKLAKISKKINSKLIID